MYAFSFQTSVKACFHVTGRRHRQNQTVAELFFIVFNCVPTTVSHHHRHAGRRRKNLAPLKLRHSALIIEDNISFQAVRSAVTVLYSDGHQTMY